MTKRKTNIFVAYTDDYKQKCFVTWYSAGRPKQITMIKEILPKDEHGRVPNLNYMARWKREEMWDERADELDAKANAIVETDLVMQKAEMLQRQAQIGKDMQQKGIEHIRNENNKIDSTSAAIAMVVKGAELERMSIGGAEFLARLSKMSDDDVRAEILKLAARTDSVDVVDAEEVEENKPEDKAMSE